MRISIIIPVFNEAEAMPALLDDIQRLAAEVIFVDGGSSDPTAQLARDSGYRVLATARGRGGQMNAGAAAARGDILLFQHADTRLPRGALDAIRRSVEGGAVGGNFDLALDSRRPTLRLIGALITWRSRLTGVATGDQCLFVSREAFERLGGFGNLPLFEDIDMSRRLRRLGRRARLRPPVVTSPRRWEREGTLRTVVRMWLLKGLYYLGVSPDRLAQHYGVAR